MDSYLYVFGVSIQPVGLLVVCAVTVLCYLLQVRLRPGLRDIPGPFWASFLPLDRVVTLAKGHQYATHIKYHETYGPLVRVGPNHVSFSDGVALSHVYSITSKFQKVGSMISVSAQDNVLNGGHQSDFYKLFDAKSPVGNLPTIFSIRDEAAHRSLKRPVANAYSMGTMVELEPLTDSCIKILEQKLDGLQNRDVDLGEWLHWYAFDVITSITFSNRLGFMEQEKDVGGIIDAVEGRLMYNSVIGQVPFLNNFLLGNRVIEYCANVFPILARLNKARYIVQFAAKQLERYQGKDKAQIEYRDMLDRFKRYKDGQKVMSDKELLAHASSNIFAGSDTTAISLRSMFYYFCKNPRSYAKLVAEIDDIEAQHKLSNPITFAESQQMPYLQACMKEAMRLHPAVGLLLERIVPEGGTFIAGKHLPAGTIVGANPWVVARDRDVYGADASEFRPERWLEANPARLKVMDRNDLAFGSGARTCLGKNISLLEMSKLVPQILRNFTIELADPEKDWQLADYWFVKQTNLICRVRRR